MTGAEIDRQKKTWITEGIIIAFCPVVAYLMTFAYEAGYVTTFGIPLAFISLDVTTFIIAAGAVVFILIMLFTVFLMFSVVIDSTQSQLYQSLKVFIYVLPVFIISLLVYQTFWKWEVVGFFIVTVLSAIAFVLSLIAYHLRGKPSEEAVPPLGVRDTFLKIWDSIGQSSGTKLVILFLFMWLMTAFSYAAGKREAIYQKEFFIYSGAPELVVLRIYRDSIIGAPFDRKTKEVQKSLVVIRPGLNSKMKLDLESVGPLRRMEP